jgi:hypothetical protein
MGCYHHSFEVRSDPFPTTRSRLERIHAWNHHRRLYLRNKQPAEPSGRPGRSWEIGSEVLVVLHKNTIPRLDPIMKEDTDVIQDLTITMHDRGQFEDSGPITRGP